MRDQLVHSRKMAAVKKKKQVIEKGGRIKSIKKQNKCL